MPDSLLTQLFKRLDIDQSRARALGLYVLRQFGQDQCIASAGMLAYATLLALVPLTAVALAIASAFPAFESTMEQAREFLFSSFVPAARDTVEQYILEFATKASGLTATMSIALVVTSLLLMSNIDATLNRIWNVHRPRSLVNRIMVYWTALSLGPILLGLSVGLSSYFFSLSFLDQARGIIPVSGVLQRLAPFVFAGVGFFLLFIIVPNRRVEWRHALIGGLVTALMFEIAKTGFGFYIARFSSYEKIYGAIATVPIFLIWLYLSWAVILLGASFTASLGSFRYRTPGSWQGKHEFVLLYRLVGHLWEAQSRGEGLSSRELLDREPGADDQQLQPLMENLLAANFVSRNEREDWVLVRDLREVSVADLYATGQFALPLDLEEWPDEWQADAWNRAFAAVLDGVAKPASRELATSLKQLYAADGSIVSQSPRKVTAFK